MNKISSEIFDAAKTSNILARCAVRGIAAIEKVCDSTEAQKWLKEIEPKLKKIREEREDGSEG